MDAPSDQIAFVVQWRAVDADRNLAAAAQGIEDRPLDFDCEASLAVVECSNGTPDVVVAVGFGPGAGQSSSMANR